MGKDPLPASARVFLRVELGIPAELVEAASVSFLVAVDVKRSEGEAGKKGDEGGRSVASAVAVSSERRVWDPKAPVGGAAGAAR